MSNRFIRTVLDLARQKAGRSAAWTGFARDTARGFLTTAHHTLMIVGMGAIAALGILFVRPDFADQLKTFSPFFVANATEPLVATPPMANLMDLPAPAFAPSGPVHSVALTAEESRIVGNARQQQWVTYWLSKRYRVAGDATNMLVSAAYLTAKEIKLDPLLILAVMAIESGLNPFAESAVGAQGLMQVMSKMHHEKFQDLGGVKAALNPVANIRVGSLILKDYVTRGGSVEAGLKLYVGAAAFDTDFGYGSRVLAEYQRLKEVATGKSVPIFSTVAPTTVSTTANSATPKPAERANERKPEAPLEAESASVDYRDLPNGQARQVAAL